MSLKKAVLEARILCGEILPSRWTRHKADTNSGTQRMHKPISSARRQSLATSPLPVSDTYRLKKEEESKKILTIWILFFP